MKVIIIIIIFLIINCFLVQSQITYKSNEDIQLLESQYNNIYSNYGKLNSNYQICSFKLNYAILNTPSPQLSIDTPFSFYFHNKTLLEIQIQVGVSSDNYTYEFSIFDLDDNSISTDFLLNVFCENLDGNLLEVNLLSHKLYPIDRINYYTIYEIKGLKYELEERIQFRSSISNTINKKILDKSYLLSFLVTYFEEFVGKSIEISIIFPNKIFNFTLDPIYSYSDYQLINYQTFPASLSTSKYIEYGTNMYPLALFSTNLTQNEPFYYALGDSKFSNVKKVSQFNIGGILRYNYIFSLTNSLVKNPTTPKYSYNYILSYNNGPIQSKLNISIYDYQLFPFPSNITGDIMLSSYPQNSFTFSFSSKSFRDSPFLNSYYDFSSLLRFPFGFIRGSNLDYNYKLTFIQKPSNNAIGDSFHFYEYPNRYSVQYLYENPSLNTTTDVTAPIITYFELIPIVGFKYLLRLKLNDQSAIAGFSHSLNTIDIQFYGYETLISIDNDGWLFEFPIDILALADKFKVYDIFYNEEEYPIARLLYINSDGIPVYFDPLIPYMELNIENITFLENDINILNQPNYNTVYFNSSTLPINYPLMFGLQDDISTSINAQSYISSNLLPVGYDSNKKLFYCDFVVPKNSNPGFIPYIIFSYYSSYTFGELVSPLRVSKTAYDNEGPIVISIVNANTFGKVGWRITITDTQNGFSNGYVKVVGSLDSSIFKFNFTISDAVLDSRSTIWRGDYDIIVNVTSNRCVSQDYKIDYIYLEDTNRLYSRFDKFELYYDSTKNPLRNHLDNLEYYLKSSSKCPEAIQDKTPPELISFTPNINQLDRKASFNFTARDLESGLMPTQTPIVYLQESSRLNKIECQSTIVSINNTHAEYYCELVIPLGFGNDFSGGALISVYGFINNGGSFSGFSSDDKLMYNSSYFEIPYSTFSNLLSLTSYEPYYQYSNSNLTLYGRGIGLTDNVSIEYSDGTNKWYTPIKIISDSVLIIKRDDYPVIAPFNVTAIMKNGNKTNSITIYPISFIPTENSTDSEIPIPTNKPQECLGNPICGGPSKGYCDKESGCVCYSPWIGKDCLSQVIIIPQPNFNDSVPTTEIPIDDKESQIFYKSLISIVSLRELSLNNSIVHEHSLDRWVYSEFNSTVSQYYSSISFKSITNQNRLFEIYVTLKWYNNQTIVEFADQHFSMNPSSMKYTIDILGYQFESRVNRLQLVMHASLLSNKINDICSSKEFGDTTSGDNSNYIKIQVNSTSLYGRFIKRGVIDDRIVSLSNELLDQEMNAINNPNQVQSYIGISIPWFERQSTIDPDFSVLIDSSPASSKCIANSGLSATQIAGIVIGCFVFTTAIIIAITYSIYKTRQRKKFIKNISNKMQELKNQ